MTEKEIKDLTVEVVNGDEVPAAEELEYTTI